MLCNAVSCVVKALPESMDARATESSLNESKGEQFIFHYCFIRVLDLRVCLIFQVLREVLQILFNLGKIQICMFPPILI